MGGKHLPEQLLRERVLGKRRRGLPYRGLPEAGRLSGFTNGLQGCRRASLAHVAKPGLERGEMPRSSLKMQSNTTAAYRPDRHRGAGSAVVVVVYRCSGDIPGSGYSLIDEIMG